MTATKPYTIPKAEVYQSYLKVKANNGAAGIDQVDIKEFEKNLKDNLYKIWNRMSSGSYMPPTVRTVAIPKANGGVRKLGIPTVGDRIAQMVVKQYLEPMVDPLFHQDSYGYRPKRGAHDALATARKRCWQKNWVIDLDIKGFFDNLDHELIMRAIKKHTDCSWVLLYIERWLKASVEQDDGTIKPRDKGTPQGSVVSPILANIFMHHAFDRWMANTFPTVPFERYADDAIVHCVTEQQARFVKDAITKRLGQCKLELHQEKTKIVYCKDDNRRGGSGGAMEAFDFLGYTFQPRPVKNSKTGKSFVSFTPAISQRARKQIGKTVRGWRLHARSDRSLAELADFANPAVRGWVNYYGTFCPSALRPVLRHIEDVIIRWACRKHKPLRHRYWKAKHLLARIAKDDPNLFVHWSLGYNSTFG